MPMYNLIEYIDAYSKTSRYYRGEPALDANGEITDFPADNNNGKSFKFKQKLRGETGNDGSKDVEIMIPLNYLSHFWRTLEMPLINCEISLKLKWSKKMYYNSRYCK